MSKYRTAFCMSCGKRKRLTYDDSCCTQKCAARAFVAYVDASGVGLFEAAYCGECGELGEGCECTPGICEVCWLSWEQCRCTRGLEQ